MDRSNRKDDLLSALAAEVAEQPFTHCGATRLVLVDGRSGAGKSVLAGLLADALDGSPVVHMDDLTPGWDGLETAVEVALQNVVLPLSLAMPARYQRWDWVQDRWGDEVVLGVPEVLVVEGVGAAARAVAPFAALTVWVETPDADRHQRAMGRDGETYRQQWDRWAAQEDVHYAREGTRRRCIRVVDGTWDWTEWP